MEHATYMLRHCRKLLHTQWSKRFGVYIYCRVLPNDVKGSYMRMQPSVIVVNETLPPVYQRFIIAYCIGLHNCGHQTSLFPDANVEEFHADALVFASELLESINEFNGKTLGQYYLEHGVSPHILNDLQMLFETPTNPPTRLWE